MYGEKTHTFILDPLLSYDLSDSYLVKCWHFCKKRVAVAVDTNLCVSGGWGASVFLWLLKTGKAEFKY